MIDWAETEQALSDTPRAGWRRRAVGLDPAEAMARLPVLGNLQTQLPIGAFRAFQAHIRRHHLTQAEWVRRAIFRAYLAEGGDPAVIEAARRPINWDRDRRRP